MNQKNSRLRHRLRFAINGILAAFKSEASLRFQVLTSAGLMFFCILFRPSAIWCAIFAAMATLVISLELVNSAFEAVLDELHPEHNKAIGFAKDCLAGSVLVASASSVLVFVFYLFSLS